MDFFKLTAEQVLEELKSSERGLTPEEVEKRLAHYGVNELQKKKRVSPFKIFFSQFRNFIVYILFGAVFLSLFLHEYIDSAVILVILLLNAVLGFFQEFNAEKAIEALKKLGSLQSTVLRDGRKLKVETKDVVPGDIIVFEAGDKIPADARIMDAFRLEVMEAMLTGESAPVRKVSSPLESSQSLGDMKNMVFSGTSVTYGSGKAVIVRTGMDTEIGKIAASLESVEDEKTPLQNKLEVLGKRLGMITLFICAMVILFGLFRGGDLLEMIMVGVSLAVAAIPEGLPIVVTIALALGVRRMAGLNSLVKRLPSVETLGCTTVICTDKTGTLTRNEMTVTRLYVNRRVLEVTGTGYETRGQFLDGGKEVPFENILPLLKIGLLNSDAALGGSGEVIGDPTEGSLIVSAAKAGLEKYAVEKQYPRKFEIPFDSERKRKSTVHEMDGEFRLLSKGAPDVVLSLCKGIEINGEVRELKSEEKQKILEVNKEFAEKALRVLAFAWKPLSNPFREEEVDENGLVFVGLQGMMDPPRPEVREAVSVCRKAGIRTVMITGDYAETARAIARELGMEGEALSGSDLNGLSDEELSQTVRRISVFARVNPEHKIKIVRSLRKSGEIVAMTGDGVNDAPAIKEADIGIAMGITGTDVSKEAADMILMDDKFTSIMHAVEQGRAIYENIQKFVNYLLSSNLGEVLVLFLGMVFCFKDPETGVIAMPLLATQILWLNLVTDGLPAVALGVDPARVNIMNFPPRNPGEKIINRGMALNILQISILMSCGVLFLFGYYLPSGVSVARTVAFTAIVLLEMVRVTMIRSQYQLSFFSNPSLIGAIVLSIFLQAGVVYSPFGNRIFKTVPLGPEHWLAMGIVMAVMFVLGMMGNQAVRAVCRVRKTGV